MSQIEFSFASLQLHRLSVLLSDTDSTDHQSPVQSLSRCGNAPPDIERRLAPLDWRHVKREAKTAANALRLCAWNQSENDKRSKRYSASYYDVVPWEEGVCKITCLFVEFKINAFASNLVFLLSFWRCLPPASFAEDAVELFRSFRFAMVFENRLSPRTTQHGLTCQAEFQSTKSFKQEVAWRT